MMITIFVCFVHSGSSTPKEEREKESQLEPYIVTDRFTSS